MTTVEDIQTFSIPESATQSAFKFIPLADILPDEHQPRKFFDQVAMNELVESVKKNGVLQPIMVRYTAKDQVYILVCGERRYRAALFAGHETVPAVIRHLTDLEALEIQIIENLQRKDVHPMEEAVAFKSLRESFEVEEIAARVGKSGSYVAQRIKLTELIDDFQEMLFLNKMKLQQAILLCRVGANDQKEILTETTKWNKDWKTNKNFELGNVEHYVTRAQLELSKAPFKTNDPLLYPEMGPCNKCPYNTANNPLLFPELNKKRYCTNSVCYQIKCDRSYQASIQMVMAEPDVLLVNASSYLSSEQKLKVKAAEEIGAVVLNEDMFDVLQKPEHPGSYDDYLKEAKEGCSDEEWTPENDQECRSDYDSEVDEYNLQLENYEKAVSEGRVRKAFVVVGNYRAKEGEMIDIVIKPKKGAKVQFAGTSSEMLEDIQRQTEILAIKDRETRNKELDREKVFKRVMEAFKEPFTTSTADDLLPEEWKALAFLMVENSYKARDFLQAKFNTGSDWNKIELYRKFVPDDATISQLVRVVLYDKLVNPSVSGDYGKYGNSAMMFELAKLYIPDQVKQFEAEQNEKADKRIKNVEKRLFALKSVKEDAGTQEVREQVTEAEGMVV